MPIFIFKIIFFVLGAIIGSFLNVVIFRINTGKSMGGRSACVSCRHTLSWYELVPIASFILLGGRCKHCKTKISLQYICIETITGVIFMMLFSKFQDLFFLDTSLFGFIYIYYAIMFSILIVIATYDIKHKIIPDKLSYSFAIISFLSLFFLRFTPFDLPSFSIHIPSIMQMLAGVFLAVPFYLFWLLSRGTWMGLGDAKLALGIGWFLGIVSALSAVVLAFWSGAIVGLFLIFFGRGYGMKSEIPFGPYLVLGVILVFVFGLNVLDMQAMFYL
jgi:leader peptidase (prepilin peptidase)/N-methyltransferase